MLIPAELQPFIPYNMPPACVEDANGTIFRAVLGSIGQDKTSFHVHVWSEAANGVLTVIPIHDPPNNGPTLYVRSGKLILAGALGTTLVEREISDYIAPPPILTLNDILNAIIIRLKLPASGLYRTVADVAVQAVGARLE